MTKLEKKLLTISRKLDRHSQNSLIDFAEFLLEKGQVGLEKVVLQEPQLEIGPENESVIAAIKRLQRSYKMLDTNSLFSETSGLMSAHLVQGRPAEQVVVELETLFAKRYQLYLAELQSQQ